MKLVQNIKFSTEITYRSVIFIAKLQFSCKILKTWFSKKITKITDFGQKLQFFSQTDSRSVHFNEKIQILSKFLCSNNSPEFNEILEIIRFS